MIAPKQIRVPVSIAQKNYEAYRIEQFETNPHGRPTSVRGKEVSPPELLGRAQIWVTRGPGAIFALPSFNRIRPPE
jgi:hypothetical protein